MKLTKTTLDKLGFVGRGRSRHRPRNDQSLFGGDYPFIQTGEVKAANLYITNSKETYNEKGLAQSKLWNKDTLAITIAANIADTAILKIKSCFPDSIVAFIPFENVSDVKYVKYYIDYIKLELQAISQGTTQDNMSLDKLLTRPIYVHDYPTQKKIASILSAYDDLIENNNQRIKLLEEMADDIYKEWFVRMRFPATENSPSYKDSKFFDKNGKEVEQGTVGALPEGWEEKRIKSFGKVITGKTPSKTDDSNFSGEIPFIKTPDMHQGMFFINTDESLSKKGADSQTNQYVPENSISVSCIGTVGKVGITTKKSQTNQQINTLIPKSKEYTEFLYFAILVLKPIIESYAATGATMANLSKSKFENLKLVKPNANLISKYHHLVEPMFNEIKTLLSKNQVLQETRDLLLPRLISGKLSVEGLEIESEERLGMAAEPVLEYE